MKTIKLVIATLIFSLGLLSCSESDESPTIDTNPLEDYKIVSSLRSNGDHTIEVYSEQEQFTIGYNELFIRIKNNVSGNYVPNADISWKPVMHMAQMNHSCPKSDLVSASDKSVYKGFVIFQMAGNVDEYWDLTFDYTIDGEAFSASQVLDVKAPADDKRRVNTFTGSDDTRYVLAMIPFEPQVALNDFSALLFKMENMMEFSVVENYKILLDPRMPGMGNHGAPNNEDLIFDSDSKLYQGKLSLTMTGLWKINMKLLNASDTVIKGEDVTDENLESSLFFELEF